MVVAEFEQPLGRPLQILKMTEEKSWRSQLDEFRTALGEVKPGQVVEMIKVGSRAGIELRSVILIFDSASIPVRRF